MVPEWYRLLLRLLPKAFRLEYSDEMCRVVEEHWLAVRGRVGVLGSVRFWIRQGWAVVRAAVGVRLPGAKRDTPWRIEEIIAGGDDEGGVGMDGFWHDARYALRALLKRPGFAAVTAVTLALGIGSSTAIFSAVHAVLLRDLPYGDPDRIMVLFHEDTETGERANGFSPANARDLKESATLLSQVAVAEPWSRDYQVDGRAESLRAWAVSEGFFEALGVSPIQGRGFAAEEHVLDGEPVVLVGHRSWQVRFGGDPDLVGGTLVLDNQEVTVIGVLPADFKLPDEAELWVPRPWQEYDQFQRDADYIMGVARIAPGVSLAQASSEVDRIAGSLAQTYPESNSTMAFRLIPLRDHLFGDARLPLIVLMGAVGLVLLIACANVAGLMLARGAQRHREFALRSALGASSGRLVRQISIESLLLAAVGCVLGIGLTYLGVQVIQSLGPDHLPRIDEVAVDGVVLAFAVTVAGLSALLSGITPSLRFSKPDVTEALSEGSRGSTAGPRGLRLRNRLVVVEIAAAMMLLVGAGLLGKSFTVLLDEELGFDPTNRLALQAFVYDYENPGDMAVFVREAIENMEALPGVRRVALTTSVPSATDGTLASIDINLGFTIENRDPPPLGQEPMAQITWVSEGLFEVLDVPLVEGRGFEDNDDTESPRVIIVNETLARRHFGDRSALGERLLVGFRPMAREIVGVVADTRPRGYESEPRPEVYFPLSQDGNSSLTFVLETETDAGALTQAAMEAMWQANPNQSIWGAATLESLLADWLTERRFNLMLLGSFGVIALLLAGIGIYGLISFSVEQRIGEMGIRRALGGQSSTILRMVLWDAGRLAGTGILLGVVGALGLTRFIQGMLFGVEPTDPATFLALGVTVLLVAALAVLVPALKAVRADPMVALRTE